MIDIGLTISTLLKDKGLSQKELASRMKVSAQYIGQIINGSRRPTYENLGAIEKALNQPIGSLTNGLPTKDLSYRRPVSLASMPGVEVAYIRVAMDALREARRVLHSQSPEGALRRAAGKDDTYMFDAGVERVIIDKLRAFNDKCAIFTEEANVIGKRENAMRMCYLIDPFDRSTPFANLLKQCVGNKPSGDKLIGDMINGEDYPMTGLSSPFGSISCVRENRITFNVMMDYSSGEIYVACKAMLKHGSIDECPDPEALAVRGSDIRFEPRKGKEYACFLGKEGSSKRELYEQHLKDLDFRPGHLPRKELQDPGGPARILYLSDDPALATENKLACILANGEKICEWFGWLAYVAHSNELAAYELYARKFSARDELLLAPPPNYSMFTTDKEGQCQVNLDRILVLNTPVFYRSAIVITHIASTEVVADMNATNCRELSFHPRS